MTDRDVRGGYTYEVHSEDIENAVVRAVEEAFAGRKGHGGGPCSRRSMTKSDLGKFGVDVVRKLIQEKRRRESCSASAPPESTPRNQHSEGA